MISGNASFRQTNLDILCQLLCFAKAPFRQSEGHPCGHIWRTVNQRAVEVKSNRIFGVRLTTLPCQSLSNQF